MLKSCDRAKHLSTQGDFLNIINKSCLAEPTSPGKQENIAYYAVSWTKPSFREKKKLRDEIRQEQEIVVCEVMVSKLKLRGV